MVVYGAMNCIGQVNTRRLFRSREQRWTSEEQQQGFLEEILYQDYLQCSSYHWKWQKKTVLSGKGESCRQVSVVICSFKQVRGHGQKKCAIWPIHLICDKIWKNTPYGINAQFAQCSLIPRLSPSASFYMCNWKNLSEEESLGGFDHMWTLMMRTVSTVHMCTVDTVHTISFCMWSKPSRLSPSDVE